MSQAGMTFRERDLDTKRRQAWRSYFALDRLFKEQIDFTQSLSERLDDALVNVDGQESKSHIPPHIRELLADVSSELKEAFVCSICTDSIDKKTLYITECGHMYHKACMLKLKEQPSDEHKCPMCRKKLYFQGLNK
jgi:hypothetical protein